MTTTLTLDDLPAAVKELLDLAGVPYDDDELRNSLGAVWGRVKLDPDPRTGRAGTRARWG